MNRSGKVIAGALAFWLVGGLSLGLLIGMPAVGFFMLLIAPFLLASGGDPFGPKWILHGIAAAILMGVIVYLEWRAWRRNDLRLAILASMVLVVLSIFAWAGMWIGIRDL